MLVNAIGFYGEAAGHHPDLEVHWGSVSVALSTHSAGGITPKDVALAKQFEQTALWQAGPPFRPAEKFGRQGERGALPHAETPEHPVPEVLPRDDAAQAS